MKKAIIFVSVLAVCLVSMTSYFTDAAYAQGPVIASPYRLIGTVQGEAFTGAVFVNSSGVQKVSRIYDTLPDGSQIIKVRNDSILLKRSDGTTYELFITQDKAVSKFALPSEAVPSAPADIGVPSAEPERIAPDARPGHEAPDAQPENTVPDTRQGSIIPDARPGHAVPETQPEISPNNIVPDSREP